MVFGLQFFYAPKAERFRMPFINKTRSFSWENWRPLKFFFNFFKAGLNESALNALNFRLAFSSLPFFCDPAALLVYCGSFAVCEHG